MGGTKWGRRDKQKIEAFDVIVGLDQSVPDDFDPSLISVPLQEMEPTRVRKLASFEGHDQFGRLQPLLGTAEPATDKDGNPINWPDTETYCSVGLVLLVALFFFSFAW